MRETNDLPCRTMRRIWRSRALGFAAGALCASAVAWATGADEPRKPAPVPTLYSGRQTPDVAREWRWSPPGVRYESMYRGR